MSSSITDVSFSTDELRLIRDVIKRKTGDHEIWKLDYRIKEYQKSDKLCEEAKNHPKRMKFEALMETALTVVLLAGVVIGCWAMGTAGLSGGAALLGIGILLVAGNLLGAYYDHRWQCAVWEHGAQMNEASGSVISVMPLLAPIIPLWKVLRNRFEITKNERLDDMNRSLERCKGSIGNSLTAASALSEKWNQLSGNLDQKTE